jgi:hypothetical protein
VVVEELVVLLFELLDSCVEVLDDSSNVLQVVLLESFELLDSTEKLNKLGNTSAEEIEFTKDLVGREFELFTLRHAHKSLFGDLVLLLVSLVEIKAALKNWDELLRREFFMFPEDVIRLYLTLLDSDRDALPDLLVVQNVELTIGDHLVSDFDEEISHSVISVIVPGDGMNHLD